VLLAFWSPKGGSGTTVVAAVAALVLARSGGVRLADLDGDHPAVFGLGADPELGLVDWLAAAPEVPTEALDRLAVEVAPRCLLVPRGVGALVDSPSAGAALAVALRDGPVPTVVDVGSGPPSPVARAVLDVADVSIVVLRACYLGLRRAVASGLLEGSMGAVLVAEPGRAIGAREVADVLGRPVLAQIEASASVARAVDAGVLASRLPEPHVRRLRPMLDRVGVRPQRPGRAA